MIDDDHPPADDAPYARIYDYFKHLTTVSLVSIGGVLGLLQGQGPAIKPLALILVISLLAAAGFLAMVMLAAISSMTLKKASEVEKVRKSMLIVQGAATFCLMFGLGIFLGAFVGALI